MAKFFYNTTGETGSELDDFTLVADEQQRKILDYVKANPKKQFTSEDLGFLLRKNTPITSIRRAVCNIKKLGEIEVVGKTKGAYGRPIFVYQYCIPISQREFSNV